MWGLKICSHIFCRNVMYPDLSFDTSDMFSFGNLLEPLGRGTGASRFPPENLNKCSSCLCHNKGTEYLYVSKGELNLWLGWSKNRLRNF